ncbi:holin [Erwinia typographi]|uniref:Holin n=1 Tax=Erwinia typographi TaxID=371042 RepID=A0A0A3YNW8_9GAMM|nr:phage holin family protein [Erwinia typographi]KGT87229.1 holin [Erwinia typographi]
MVISDPLVLTNVITCSAIVLRLMSFRKPGGQHNPWASWLAYLIILAYASVPFRYFFDFYVHAHWASVTINLIICAAVFRARGNVARLFHSLRPQ